MGLFLQSIWQVLLELAPWLLLGSLVAGAMHVLLPADFLRRQLTGSFGLLKAVGIGVPLPLCSCAVIPVGLSLKQGGASSGATVAFLISTPQTGVDSILVSASFLGWPFALFKVASAALTGLLGGWWTDQENSAPTLSILSRDEENSPPSTNRWLELLGHSLELLRSIWRWLLFGVVVSAAITTFLPTGAVSSFAGGSELAAMLMTLVIALPLYVCATASVPIAAALVASGLPVGAALVFLMAGPATNMATIGAVYRALGKRSLTIYLATVVLGSISCGWLFGFLIETSSVSALHSHASANWWSMLCALLLVFLLAWFAFEDITRTLKSSDQPRGHQHDAETSCCK